MGNEEALTGSVWLEGAHNRALTGSICCSPMQEQEQERRMYCRVDVRWHKMGLAGRVGLLLLTIEH